MRRYQNQQCNNDNVISYKEINNDNVRRYNKVKKVDHIADHLVRKFKAPGSRNFFCKCAWKMSEDEIWSTYEQANKPKVKFPLKYFITVCTIKMAK